MEIKSKSEESALLLKNIEADITCRVVLTSVRLRNEAIETGFL